MSIAVITDLTKSYGAELIFSGVSFRIEARDRLGLVGPNGAGKTTLLNLLAGRLTPDAGSVVYAQGTTIGYLPQIAEFAPTNTLHEEMLAALEHVRGWEREMGELAARMGDPATLADPDEYAAVMERYADVQARFEHAGGYTIEQRARQVLDGLGFTREQQAAPATQLSGGQQTRAALGRLLLQEPDLLLLDEPTNHLDLAALEWLEDYLGKWDGSVVVVSHDRYFLDRVSTRTLEIDHQRGDSYPGNYTKYMQLRAERLERWAKEYEAQQEHIAHTEEFVRRYKAGQRAKEARGRQKQLDRLERIERPPTDDQLKFRLGAKIEPGQITLTTESLIVGYPPTASAPGLRVCVADMLAQRGARIGLIGPNGAGKTTLLRAIVGQLQPLDGRLILGHNVQIGYYAQTHENLNLRATVLDEIRRAAGTLSEEGARSYLGRFLFSGDDVFKLVGSLSGGERSRVALAKLTLQGANFLVLDEPTNHLDLPARQALESILSGYDGTLLFVSHDRYFVDALATTVWTLDDGQITAHVGNYTAVRTRRAQTEAAEAARQERQARQAKAAARATAARANQQGGGDAVVVADGPRTVAQLERDLEAASAAAEVARITELGDAYEDTKAQLDALYGEWEELAS